MPSSALFTALAACLLLHNPTVIDPASKSVRRVDVVIRDARIAQGPCDRSVDLTGKFLLPGFIDMHAHLLLHPWDDKGNIRPRYDRPALEQMLRTLLAFGVTTIRDPGAETEAAIHVRELLRSGKLVGPRLYTAGRILSSSRLDVEPFVLVSSADDVKREIGRQAAAAVDLVKVYASLPPELVKVAIDEAHARHLPVIGHLQTTTWTEAANMDIDGVEHAAPWSAAYLPAEKRAAYRGDLFGRVYWLENTDDAAIAEMIRALVAHHVVVDPTLVAMHTKFFGNDPRWLKNSDLRFVPQIHRKGWPAGSFTRTWSDAQYREAQAAWPRLLALTRQMFDAGVTMTVGTDMPTPWIVPGASVHDEMVLLHDAGIPAMDVLRMATWNAALALGKVDEIGQIRVGMVADLVVLTKDPLDDIRNTRSIETVYKGGIPYR
jgi:imidazolonepropionase-like amidohydrolase